MQLQLINVDPKEPLNGHLLSYTGLSFRVMLCTEGMLLLAAVHKLHYCVGNEMFTYVICSEKRDFTIMNIEILAWMCMLSTVERCKFQGKTMITSGMNYDHFMYMDR